MEPSAALQCALAGGVPLSPPFAGMGLGLEVALALEPDEGGELLVLLLRQGVGDAGDESLDQRDPLSGASELAWSIRERSTGWFIQSVSGDVVMWWTG
jgi:hypothetical protein